MIICFHAPHTRCVIFLAQKGVVLWKKYLEKPIRKSSWMPGRMQTTPITKPIEPIQRIAATRWIQTTRRISKDITHKGVIKSWVMWNGHQITPSGTINEKAEAGNCLRLFYIPDGMISSMKYSRLGTACPVYCRWHSHKSSSRPKGVSHVSSMERWSCASP